MSKLTTFLLAASATLVFSSCVSVPNEGALQIEVQEVTREIEVTREVEIREEIPVTRQVEVTREVPVTRLVVVSPTPPPTELPGATPTPPHVEDAIAFNFLGEATTGPLNVELARVLFVKREVLISWIAADGRESGWVAEMGDSPVIGELILRIANNGDQVVKLWPFFQGAVTVNTEQIRLEDFRSFKILDELDQELFPGATVVGGIYFGVKRTTLSEINSFVYYTLENPFDVNSYASLGPTISISADLSNHMWEPYPAELR